MENSAPGQLAGREIHGFPTLEDLDVGNIMKEAEVRWLRPNEIHAMLCNYKYFSINVKPVNLPKSGAIVLFDRKMLRNFRKDGYNWKKKKDGKTVKEAHEHLKVGDEERIHVYYAHGEDNPTFVRRCYWLLDKKMEHIVLVHYRETQELQGSPFTPVDSIPKSTPSDPSVSWLLSKGTGSGADPTNCATYRTQLSGELCDNTTLKNHEMRLHEINTLEWEELLVSDDPKKMNQPHAGRTAHSEEQNQYVTNGRTTNDLSANGFCAGNSIGSLCESFSQSNSAHFNVLNNVCSQRMEGQTESNFQRMGSQMQAPGMGEPVDIMGKDGLQTQDSFGKWMNYFMIDSPGSVDGPTPESSIMSGHDSSTSPMIDHLQSSVPGQIFSITDVSPSWAFSTEETKILITGVFNEGYSHHLESNIYCVCGEACSPAEIVQPGVFRCLVSPHSPGLVNLYLSFDGHHPISQLMTFEYRAPLRHTEDKSNWEQFRVQMRLAHLLFSTSKSLSILSSKVSARSLKEAKTFAHKTSHIADSWTYMVKSIANNKISSEQAKDSLFELVLKTKLYEWLLERVAEGSKTSDFDDHGQGVIHLCSILDYTWAVCPFAWSGMSLDYRDKFGWTGLHWAAYYGREKMVAALLSAGAKPNLVTDPNSENPGGCTAADLASMKGYDGLAAYLAEKALVEQFNEMTIAGNVSGSLQASTPNLVKLGNFNQEEQYLKGSLAAYRTAAEAAARIQAAFREHSFKLRTKAVQLYNTEEEARGIVAAMKIQHAFRSYKSRKIIAAAARIQHSFRTWKTRKEFVAMRHHAIKIQAVFRGFQVRKQYRKIIWSVGVLEKVILRWRMKRRGLRGLQVCPAETDKEQEQDCNVEEDFFRASRKQADERVERSVVKVQTLFRSKKAQEEYHKMKLAHDQARLEYEVLVSPDIDMG